MKKHKFQILDIKKIIKFRPIINKIIVTSSLIYQSDKNVTYSIINLTRIALVSLQLIQNNQVSYSKVLIETNNHFLKPK